MRIFLSWSGVRSKAVAMALRDWLPLLLQNVEPWFSDKDIAAGDRWSVEIGRELDSSQFGIVCLTRDNLNAPWILFESGALSKMLAASAVIPYLLDADYGSIAPPLSQFQAKKAERGSTLEVVKAINGKMPKPIDDGRIEELFDALWPRLEQRLLKAPVVEIDNKKHRTSHDVLEELVAATRGLERRLDQIESSVKEMQQSAVQLLRSTSQAPVAPYYVRVTVEAALGKMKRGQSLLVATDGDDLINPVALAAGLDPYQFEEAWCLRNPGRGGVILDLGACQSISAYFKGAAPLVALDDCEIPF